MTDADRLFNLLVDINIIAQLSSAALEAVLPDGMKQAHFAVLNHLVRINQPQTPVVIASAMQVTKGAMTNTLNRLLKQDFIEIVPDKNDGRSKIVTITEKGIQARSQAIDNLAPTLTKLLKKLDSPEIFEIQPQVTSLKKILDKDRSS